MNACECAHLNRNSRSKSTSGTSIETCYKQRDYSITKMKSSSRIHAAQLAKFTTSLAAPFSICSSELFSSAFSTFLVPRLPRTVFKLLSPTWRLHNLFVIFSEDNLRASSVAASSSSIENFSFSKKRLRLRALSRAGRRSREEFSAQKLWNGNRTNQQQTGKNERNTINKTREKKMLTWYTKHECKTHFICGASGVEAMLCAVCGEEEMELNKTVAKQRLMSEREGAFVPACVFCVFPGFHACRMNPKQANCFNKAKAEEHEKLFPPTVDVFSFLWRCCGDKNKLRSLSLASFFFSSHSNFVLFNELLTN